MIGSGPAGLTAAYYLARMGHGVTVFEALPFPGGMMRFGIPEYRLPRDVLESEIQEIQKAGVEIRTNSRIESLDSLFLDQGFDAVLVALGRQASLKLPLPGTGLEGVWNGLSFLKDFNLLKKVETGNRILVLGGGNVAFDCARVARRLGAEEVGIACLESREGLSATPEEIEQGEEEGITIYPSRTFTEILKEEGKITGVACLRVASFEFDQDGKPEIETIEGSHHVLTADTIILAVGQLPDVPEPFDLDLDERGFIETDPYTFDTSAEGVFAAGDAVPGSASVIEAVASGRRGAAALDKYLGGDGEIDKNLAPPAEATPWLGPGEGFADLKRCREPKIGGAERVKSFCSISQTMDEETAGYESARCLQCDLRLGITPVRFWGDY
ncbi:MAG: FAD-dependent oxidoreductase [Desulfatiglandaceae bacterium]